MASRTKQKEEARARRLAEERARAERARRQRRLQMVGGTVLAAVIVVVVAILVSSGGGGSGKVPAANSSAAKAAQARVDTLLAGIPESGNTLGSPSAKVTVTEFGDLECSICDEFALAPSQSTVEGGAGSGYENQLISQYVRTGKVKLVYRSLETASSESPIANVFPTQQAAAVAAGYQDKEWYYLELFYNQQGEEGTGYVTTSYLNNLARQVPGLNFAKWTTDRSSSRALSTVQSDEQAASTDGFNSTPTIVVQGPKGVGSPIVGLPTSFSQLTSEIAAEE